VTYQELVDAVISRLAPLLPDQNIDILVEEAAQRAFSDLAEIVAADPERRHTLVATETLTVTNGAATLDGTQLLSRLEDFTATRFVDADAGVIEYSYVREWSQFTGRRERRLGVWTVQNGYAFSLIEPDAGYDPAVAGSVEISLTGPRVISRPANATAPITLPADLVEDLVNLTETLARQMLAPEKKKS
jgi:hypothetical protein